MKKIKIAFWIFTILFSALILLGSISDMFSVPQALAEFKRLGYPAYLSPFLGVAKTLGIIAILVPGFPRLKEWAYAGLFFDITGAFYSGICVGDSVGQLAMFGIVYILLFGSYICYHKLKRV